MALESAKLSRWTETEKRKKSLESQRTYHTVRGMAIHRPTQPVLGFVLGGVPHWLDVK